MKKGSSWRPKGWKNPLTKERLKEEHNDFSDVGEAYEAGADAMLKALRKELPPHLYVSLCSQREGHQRIKGDKIYGKRLKKAGF